MKNSDEGCLKLGVRLRKTLFPIIAGASVFLVYPSLVSNQDVATLTAVMSGEFNGPRWLASITEAPGVSQLLPNGTAGAAVPADAGTESANEAMLEESAVKRLTTSVRAERAPQRVNRSLKGGRVVSATMKRPPAHFSAGSVVERHSMFAPLDIGDEFELAFVEARPAEEALKIASAFQIHVERPKTPAVDPDLPVMVASLVEESAPNLLSYSEAPKRVRSPFAMVLKDTTPVNIVPRLNKGDHRWAANPLPKSASSKGEQHCLAAGIYFEARGEPVKGQAAVSQVILNRVRNPAFPDTICGVVYQNKHWRNRCQFSFACDKIKDKATDSKRWKIAQYVARETTEGRIWLKEVGSSTHYHATYVKPKWARAMKKVSRIGLHIFYRTFKGGWS